MTSRGLNIGIVGAAILAAFFVVGVFYWSDLQIKGKQIELIKLETLAEQLENELEQLTRTYANARQHSLETNTRLTQARLDLIRIQTKHRAELDEARKKTEATIQVIETQKEALPTLDDRQLAVQVESKLPGAIITPLKPHFFEVNRQALIQVGILALDLQACQELNLLVTKERDTAQLNLKLEKQITTSWEEQFTTKEKECLACAAALHTTEQLEDNLNQRLDAESTRADAWERKWKLQKWFTYGGFGLGVVGGIVIGSLAQ